LEYNSEDIFCHILTADVNKQQCESDGIELDLEFERNCTIL